MPQFSPLTVAAGKLLWRLPARRGVSVIAKFNPTLESALSIRRGHYGADEDLTSFAPQAFKPKLPDSERSYS
jgi:hypothetical protein